MIERVVADQAQIYQNGKNAMGRGSFQPQSLGNLSACAGAEAIKKRKSLQPALKSLQTLARCILGRRRYLRLECVGD
jgi:hypothetical protein